MRLIPLATAALMVISAPAFAQQTFGPLLTPEQAAEAQASGEALFIDIRAGEEGKPQPYAEGHIAGAVSAPYGLFRGPADNPGKVPEADRLTEILQGLGVTADRPTVIVHEGKDATDFGAAARVYWTLKSSGVSQLAIINGGMRGWQEAGLPLSTEAASPSPSDFTVAFSDAWLATEQDVREVVEGEGQATLIDARPQEFWEGKKAAPAAARPGTLPQSEYFTHDRWFGSNPAVMDADRARTLATEAGYTGGEELISFCNTGHWAATNWFALSELAGVENVKLYPESMVGWSNAGLPMENVPGPLQNLWNQISGVF
ncbi:sulfurtransferase [Cereibacter azotoformans]|uniref:sulfurtransferase n=1 Tax=Cereibacter azotoformans TaxID=43057 RepID=UPI000C6C9F75|nr:rhodanese-like domain-containing protein [Cereibacter azotoformans]